MAYDEALAARIRERMQEEADLTEKKMFGGIGWMLGGNMAVGASGQGGLLLRVDPRTGHELVDGDRIRPMEMRGRSMAGWLRVAPAAVTTDEELYAVMQHGIDYARSLPPK